MKKRQNNSARSSALPITFISLSAVLLTLMGAPAKNQFEQKPASTSTPAQNAHRRAAVSAPNEASRRPDASKTAGVELSASHQRVGGREIAGFSARTAQKQNLTPPAGLEPVEQEAWLAMARRQAASDGTALASFYPVRSGEPYVVEGQGVRVVVRPVGGTDVSAQIDNAQVTYRNAYPETDSMHVVSSGRSEEFLFLQNECAPREFAYELSEVSAGTRVELVKGEVHFTNRSGEGVKIEAPWLIEASGKSRTDAVHWELDGAKSSAGPQRLRLVVAAGLHYPLMIDPTWATTGNLGTARRYHTATLLSSGKVLVAGGQGIGNDSLSSAELYDPVTGTWTATGNMGAARFQHTATLLPSGKVLVAGGAHNMIQYLSSAELYDPVSGTWTATGSMGVVRHSHTATLLPSGKVLVAGGNVGAELYDPVTGAWTATANMVTARSLHTATLLASGKVLVAGGASGGPLSSAELYDPVTGTWAATGSLGTARYWHTATVLASGKVLVAGGAMGVITLSSAELYNPVTGTWAATGSLGTARELHTATLLPSGKVMVAGGSGAIFSLGSAELYDPASGTWVATGSLGTERDLHTATLLPSGRVLVAGGLNDRERGRRDVLNSAELYDSASGTWTATGNMATPRGQSYPATLLPSGKVLVAGGNDFGGHNTFSSAELYDPAAGVWTATSSLAAARSGHTATLLPSGRVLVAGGGNNSSLLSSVELYDPTSGTWTASDNIGTPRSGHTATLLPSGRVLVAGGADSSGYLSSAELYDPASGTWTATGSLATPRYFHTATLLPSGKVLVAGGRNGLTYVSSAELYDPATGTWTVSGSLGTARYFHTATLLPSGKVLVTGGESRGGDLSSAELYDPTTGTWTETAGMGTVRFFHAATLLPSGKVLVAGGRSSGSVILSSAELYDPAGGTWTATGNMATGHRLHTTTLLASGKVLLAGAPESGSVNSELYDLGLGFNPSWQPLLTAVSPSILPSGSALTASGSRFKGISEASGGTVQNSSSNYPLVQLLSLANEQTLFLPVDAVTGWSNTSFTSTPITLMTTSSSGFPIGHALVTVFANGIPSQSQFVIGATAPPPPPPAAPRALQETNVTASSFTAHWSGASGATGYRLDVSTDRSFSDYVPGYQNLDVGDRTNYDVTGLSANTQYHYRLRAYNGGGTSPNSNIINVRTKHH